MRYIVLHAVFACKDTINEREISSLLEYLSQRVQVSSVTQSLKMLKLAQQPPDIESLLADIGVLFIHGADAK